MPDANPSVTFAAAWERFQGLLALRQIEDTLQGGASPERAVFLAFLAPAADKSLTDYVDPITERLSRIPGVEPYPASYWHVTVKGFGYEMEEPSGRDEFSRDEVQAIARAAGDAFADTGPITASVGPVNGFDSVVFLEVHDAGAFGDANSRLVAGVPELPRGPYDAPNFLPHISIARFRSSEGLGELKVTLAEIRQFGEGPQVVFERIDLIRAHLSSTVPSFEVIESYALGAHAGIDPEAD